MKYLFSLLVCIIIVLSINSRAESIYRESEPLVAFQGSDSLWHFLDHLGKELFKPKKIIDVAGYSEGFFRVQILDNNQKKWAFMNKKGEIKIIPDCDLLSNFSEGMAITMKYKDCSKEEILYGFIDTTGKQVIDMIYDDAIDFKEGKAFVSNSTNRGYINKKGEFIINLDEVVGYTFSEGMAMISNKDYKMGYLDSTGNQIINLIFEEAGKFSEGLAFANDNSYIGFINKKGEFVIPGKFEFTQDFHDGIALVGKMESATTIKWSACDKKGNIIAPYIYNYMRDFNEGYASVQFGDKWGFIDKDGHDLLNYIYSFTDNFANGLAWASDKQNKKFGFINTKGNLMILVPESKNIVDLRFNRKLY